MSSFLAFLLALASSLSSTANDPARVYARPETLRAPIEVHFYKADELGSAPLPTAFAKYSLVARNQQGDAHGSYARLRIGPRDLAKAERLRMNGGDARVLREGDELVVFAINHATGYAGMKRVTVPAYVPNGTDAIPTIVGDIKLFPPEIEVIVERQLTANGVPSPMAPSKIRESGAATRQDSYLKLSTRWRVRLATAVEDDIVDGGRRVPFKIDAGMADPLVDAGHFETDNRDAGFVRDAGVDAGAAAQAGTSPLVDRGAFGAPLERPCADLDAAATARERLDCLNDEYTLTDVPAGVPSLAARLVHLSGAAQTDKQFQIRGGPQVHTLDVARRTSTSTILPIENGLHLVHVVGRPMRRADINGDGVLSDEEANAGITCRDVAGETAEEIVRRCGPDILPSDAVLVPGAPDFRDDPALFGFPSRALSIKAVYDARLRPEDGGPARKIGSFDTTREHRFRVLSVDAPKVEAGTGQTSSRELGQTDGQAHAEKGDTWYSLVAEILDPGAAEVADRGLETPGNLELRLGGDDVGMDCAMTVSEQGTGKRGIEGKCDGASLDEVINALDIVYIELFESGNSDNVLYRYNLYGTRQRTDHAAVSSDWTAEKSIKAMNIAKLEERPAKAAPSEPSISVFYLDPAELQRGTVKVCQKVDCSGTNDPLKDLDVFSYDEVTGFALGDRPTSKVTLPLVPMAGEASTTQWFKLVLPPEMAKMRGLDNAGLAYHVLYEATSPALQKWPVTFKVPEGRTESIGTMSPGHAMVANVDIADGRLLRSYPDIVLPEKSTTRSFVRFYNNQMNDVTPLGPGWSHNLEAMLLEDTPGRYLVVFDGQARVFESCVVNAVGDVASTRVISSVTSCVTDKTHGGLLRITANSTDGARTWATFSAELDTEDGVVVTFDRKSRHYNELGRRRYFATSIDDGMKEKLWFTYDGDLPTRVERATAVGGTRTGLSFELGYEEIPVTDRTSAEVNLARQSRGLRRLKTVQAKLAGGAIVAEAKFDHDSTRTNAQCGLAPADIVDAKHYNNLTRACRFTRVPATPTARAEDLRWQYTYDARRGRNLDAVLTANELKAERLDLVPIVSTATSSSLVYEASYTRNPSLEFKHPYRHINGVEVIGSATVQGERYDFVYEAARRGITYPVGGLKYSSLNKFGNVEQLVTPCGTEMTSWESSVDTGRALPSSTKDTAGFTSSCTHDGRHRSLDCKTTAPSTSLRPLAVSLNNTGTQNVEVDDDTGVVTSASLPPAGTSSQRIGVTQTVNAKGFVTGGGLVGGRSWSQPVDDNGLADGEGIDAEGNTVLVDGFAAQEFGLPLTKRVTCPLCVATASSTIDGTTESVAVRTASEETYDYDALGRLRSVTDGITLRGATTSYDALGRPVSIVDTERGETINVSYLQEGSKLTTTTTTTHGAGTATDTSVEERGLIRTATTKVAGTTVEKTTHSYSVPANGECELIQVTRFVGDVIETTNFTYGAGHLTETVVVKRDNEPLSTVSYDVLGRPALTVSGGSREEVAYDIYGNIAKRAVGSSSSGAALHHYALSYDSLGQLTEERSDVVGLTNEADHHKLIDARDPQTGRVILWSLPTHGYSEALTYDTLGRVVRRVASVKTREPDEVPVEVPTSASLIPGTGILQLAELTHFNEVDRQQRTKTLVERPQEESWFSYFVEEPTLTDLVTTFDARGHVVRVAEGDVAEEFTVVENGAGQVSQLRKTSTATSEIEETVYNDNGSTTTTYKRSASDTSPRVETSFFDGRGQTTRVVVAGGSTTNLLYDGPWLRESSETDGNLTMTVNYERSDSGRAVFRRFSLSDPDRVISEERRRETRVGRVGTFTLSVLDESAFIEKSGIEEFDGLGHRLRTRTQQVNGETVNYTSQRFVDAAGRVVSEPAPEVAGIPLFWDEGECAEDDCPAIISHPDGSVTLQGYAQLGEELQTRSLHVAEGMVTLPSNGGCYFDDFGFGSEVLWKALRLVDSGNGVSLIELWSEALRSGVPRCDLEMALRVSASNNNQWRQAGAAYAVVDDATMVTGLAGVGSKILVGGIRRGGGFLLGRLVAAGERRAAKAGTSTVATLTAKAIDAVCPGPNCPCFVEGTSVVTSDGPRPIESLVAGDVVVSWDEATNTWLERPIVRTFATPDKALMTVTLVYGDVDESITATPGHPWFVEDKGWVSTADLEAGDLVPSAYGGWAKVGSTTWEQERATVYNFEVEGTHTYAVGDSGALVHNTCVSLFHGTTAEGAARIRSQGLNLLQAADDLDFGRGFYVTKDISQAKTWARRLSRKGKGVVLEFRVDSSVLDGMRNLHIQDPNRLASFIRHHRARGMTAPFDVVEGMMLGNPGPFMAGAAPSLFGHQMAFLSDDALRILSAGLQP